jgi:putative transposase
MTGSSPLLSQGQALLLGCCRANGRARAPTNAIECLHEEFERRIKTQAVLPPAETAAMLFWALLAAGQITTRKVDGWQTLSRKLADETIDLAA